MIKNVIFDIGRVLVRVRAIEFITDKGAPLEIAEKIKRASLDTPLWKEHDRGVLKYEEVIDLFAEKSPEISAELKTYLADMKGFVEPYPYTIPWVKELKSKGLKVYYLSNWFERLYLDCREALSFIDVMDGGVFSYQEKVIKPDPEIYKRLISRYNLTPSESVFMDDVSENVEAAKKLGMNGIYFDDYERVRKELDYLINQ